MSQRPNSSVTIHTMQTTTSAPSATTGCGPAHHSWSPYGGPVIFTGPNGQRNQRVKVHDDVMFIGNGARSTETTNDSSYLTRTAPGSTFPLAKHGQVGEIGWEYETFGLVKGI